VTTPAHLSDLKATPPNGQNKSLTFTFNCQSAMIILDSIQLIKKNITKK
jgi:hypothetical protein